MKTTSVIDYIVEQLADEGITDCFGVVSVTGMGRTRTMKYVCFSPTRNTGGLRSCLASL